MINEFAAQEKFTAHNVRLNDGTFTKPSEPSDMAQHPWFKSAKRALSVAFQGRLAGRSIVDLGCLEGGYTAEFARLGMEALGIEVRQSNYENCLFVGKAINLPNLRFVHDTVWNVANYGQFDAVFCCGLLYHLDRPREFLRLISGLCRRIILVQTHFSTEEDIQKYGLSPMTENEGLPGRWYQDRSPDATRELLEASKWASWENDRSFWIQREHLIGAIHENGFDMVFEQYDCLNSPIAQSMTQGTYRIDNRCMFIGIRTGV
jgi:SAM-dependent methyltransferase